MNSKANASLLGWGALTLAFVAVAAGFETRAGLVPTDLRCEYYVDPLGVDVPQPRLFWKLASTERGQYQTAYQILVSSTPELLARDIGDLWDSGKVASDETAHIRYAGKPLNSSQRVFWKVRVWDKSGRVSSWSKPATWTMGVLTEADWAHAAWIGARTNYQTLLLRREFVVRPGLRRALIHICGLGQYELTANGTRVGDDFFPPGWTKYDKTCLYDTRELTGYLRPGTNAIGILLGNGMYHVEGAPGRFRKFRGSFGPLRAIAQIRLEYKDGSTEVICTDSRWRAHPGPITFGCVFGGEDFDARLVQHGWDKPGYDDSSWEPAIVMQGPGGKLRGLSCAAPPIRAFEVFKPISATSPTNGVTVYDLGQNASIMVRLEVRGPAGSVVRVVPAELIDTNGFVDRGSCGGRRGLAYWQYTLAGRGTEKYEAKFFYHGARYLQVERYPAPGQSELPAVRSIVGVVVHSASEPVGEFTCSNPLFNRIRKLVRWAQRSNMMSVLTDCPHRERLGWLEQYHLNGPAIRYEFDLNALYTKGMNDMADSQLENGLVPTTAPEYAIFRDPNDPTRLRNNFGDSPEWSSAAVIVPWQQYLFAGDTELFRRHYDMMKRYVAYLSSRATNHIVNHGLGDWYDIGTNAPG
ncbi:MAG: family 78 glycoside hydrolase catalytic domain, partial [Verrucomicrobiales bacterium]|nr:family 78 glycoside hydrolase catalytic domain [Verrucomicrobiales bacterium]